MANDRISVNGSIDVYHIKDVDTALRKLLELSEISDGGLSLTEIVSFPELTLRQNLLLYASFAKECGVKIISFEDAYKRRGEDIVPFVKRRQLWREAV